MEYSIVVIEDDLFTRHLIQKVLGKDFHIYETDSGRHGVELVRKFKPHAVLVDILLPGDLDGLQVLNAIKSNPETKDIPVIMMTGEAYMAAAGCHHSGAAEYFTKPFSPYQLSATVKDAIENATKRD